jgi:SpoVK/Ycf46/Vps4 family AAA+-type ATPase
MQILRVLLRTAPHCLEARHIEQLAGCTHGFVGADLQLLVKESALQALRRWRNSPQGVCVHVQSLELHLVNIQSLVVNLLREGCVLYMHL